MINSPTWLLHVPAQNAEGGVDTSSNPHLDVNGDGFDDVLVGSVRASPIGRGLAGGISVFHGSAMGIAPIANRVIEGREPGDLFGHSVACAGDVNGDGFADIVVGAIQADPGGRVAAGTASVFHGGVMGIEPVAARVLEGAAPSDLFGQSVAGAGDVNGDGFADIVVGAPQESPSGRMQAGTAGVYHGSLTGVQIAPSRVIAGLAAGDRSGAWVTGAGDLNGDGFSDIAVSAPNAAPGGRMNAGSVSVFHGSATGVQPTVARLYEGVTAGDEFGDEASTAGDVNNDGFGDLLVGAPKASPRARMSAGAVSVYHGSRDGLTAAPARLLESAEAGSQFGTAVASARDINGDGFGDVVIGAYQASPGGRTYAGGASVYFGGMSGVAAVAARVLDGIEPNDEFGEAVAGAGDLNGDGFSDLLVGAYRADPSRRNLAGTVSVYLGTMSGILPAATTTLEGLAPNDFFGFSVARADSVGICDQNVFCAQIRTTDSLIARPQTASWRRVNGCPRQAIFSRSASAETVDSSKSNIHLRLRAAAEGNRGILNQHTWQDVG